MRIRGITELVAGFARSAGNQRFPTDGHSHRKASRCSVLGMCCEFSGWAYSFTNLEPNNAGTGVQNVLDNAAFRSN